jgi:hypothetical protein
VTPCRPLVRPARRTLERGRQNPRKGYECLSHARTRRCCDVEPLRRVFSVTIGPVRPSLMLRRHPEHCSTIPGAVGTKDDKTSPRPPLCDLRPSVSPTLELTYARRPNEKLSRCNPRSRPWTGTGLAATLRQKQDSPGRPSPLWHCTPYSHT